MLLVHKYSRISTYEVLHQRSIVVYNSYFDSANVRVANPHVPTNVYYAIDIDSMHGLNVACVCLMYSGISLQLSVCI